MRWTYLLLMNAGVHAEMRVLQMVDNLQAAIVELSGQRSGRLLTLTIVIETDEPKARRIESLLRSLPSMLRADGFSSDKCDIR